MPRVVEAAELTLRSAKLDLLVYTDEARSAGDAMSPRDPCRARLSQVPCTTRRACIRGCSNAVLLRLGATMKMTSSAAADPVTNNAFQQFIGAVASSIMLSSRSA